MWAAIETLVPSVGLLFLLYVVLRHMMEADRRERVAEAKWEQRHADTTGGDKPDSPGEGEDS